MASTLTASRDAGDSAGAAPCPPPPPTSVHACPPGVLRDDRDLDALLRRAGLAPDTSGGGVPPVDGRRAEEEEDGSCVGGRRGSEGDCRVGQCVMPAVVQRLATVRSFTAMCCALAALTGA